MAVINLALKYAEKAIERFYHESITDAAFDKSRDSEFVGVKTVRIYDIGTAPVNDYQRSGTSRYGSVDELSDSVQELQMTQDKSSTWSIDKGNQKEQFNVKQAGETLQRQLREKYTPMIDKYRMQKWADGAGIAKALTAAPTKSTIVSPCWTPRPLWMMPVSRNPAACSSCRRPTTSISCFPTSSPRRIR